MGAVTNGVVERARTQYGVYWFDEWELFAQRLGIRVIRGNLPLGRAAALLDGKLFIQAGLPFVIECLSAWHEIGHRFVQKGNNYWWSTRPQGHVTVAKFERQATEFAELFPDW